MTFYYKKNAFPRTSVQPEPDVGNGRNGHDFCAIQKVARQKQGYNGGGIQDVKRQSYDKSIKKLQTSGSLSEKTLKGRKTGTRLPKKYVKPYMLSYSEGNNRLGTGTR